jgi:hypothetical protein
MKKQFDLGSEYDEWVEKRWENKILDDYFGEEVEYERSDE